MVRSQQEFFPDVSIHQILAQRLPQSTQQQNLGKLVGSVVQKLRKPAPQFKQAEIPQEKPSSPKPVEVPNCQGI
jgi:hypothetical protein